VTYRVTDTSAQRLGLNDIGTSPEQRASGIIRSQAALAKRCGKQDISVGGEGQPAASEVENGIEARQVLRLRHIPEGDPAVAQSGRNARSAVCGDDERDGIPDDLLRLLTYQRSGASGESEAARGAGD
jgi:hypothetical protein